MKDFITIETDDTILIKVIEKLHQRSLVGQKKYGTTMNREDLKLVEWLNHLQEELCDAIQYIEKLKHETNHHK
jgi:hypothetical protein